MPKRLTFAQVEIERDRHAGRLAMFIAMNLPEETLMIQQRCADKWQERLQEAARRERKKSCA